MKATSMAYVLETSYVWALVTNENVEMRALRKKYD